MSTSCADDNCPLSTVAVSPNVVLNVVRFDCCSPRTPTSVDIAVIAPVTLVCVSAINELKFGSLACVLLSEPIVASARIRSRMYDPVVEVPSDTELVLPLASKPIGCDCPSPVETDGGDSAVAGCDK